MKLLRAILLLFLLVGVGFAQPFPPNPTVGQEVTGSDGQIYVWDGVKWVRKIPGPWAPETQTSVTPPANPTAGQLWFDPLNLQTYIWYTDPTSSQWVAIVNGVGGGGGGPFLMEDNPTYTGVLTGATANFTTATINTQGLTIAGANTEANPVNHSLAVGEPIPADSDRSVIFTQGTYSATSAYNVWDAGTYLTSAGFKVSDPNGNLFHVYENAPATGQHQIGWIMAHGLTPGDIWAGFPTSQNMVLRDDANGGSPGLYVYTTVDNFQHIDVSNGSNGTLAQSGIQLTNDTGSVLYMLNEGSAYAGGGGVGQQANAKGLMTSGAGALFLQNNQPSGSVDIYSGTIHSASFRDYAIVFPNVNFSQIQFGPYQNPTGSILGHGDYGYIGMTGGGWYRGDGWLASAGAASAVTASQGNVSIAANPGLTPGTFYGPHNIALFSHDPAGLSGLALGGWGAGVNGNGGLPALNIGQSYIGSEIWGNTDICSSCYYNGQWLATGGAGGGANLFQTLYTGFRMYGAGPMGAGTVIPWTSEAYWDLNGTWVTHIQNDQGYGVPTCGGCLGFMNGSRDTNGFVQASGTWPTRVMFAKPFVGNAVCVATPLYGGGWAWMSSAAPTYVDLRCTLPGGASCDYGTWLAYHCFGLGG